jgi:hypothetical protein
MVVSGGGDIVMGQNPAWLDKINIYIKDGFSVHQGDLWAYRKAYRFTKWWLEQVRNLLALSALYFLAQKSGSWVLKVIAEVSWLLFFANFASWLTTFSFRFFPYIKNARANFWINLVLWVLIVMPIWYAVVVAINASFNAITKIAG